MVEPRQTRPCCYPGCRDGNGDPRLTRDVVCEVSRSHFRRLITEWLPLDYVTIRATMPTPLAGHAGPKVRTTSMRSYGHPAEWASDMLAAVAAALNDAETALRAHLGHAVGLDRSAAEAVRVRHAIRYLDVWWDEFCTAPSVGDSAAALLELHSRVRRALGQTRLSVHMPAPCPHCDLIMLFRYYQGVGNDIIDCRNCNKALTEPEYNAYAKSLAESVLGVATSAA